MCFQHISSESSHVARAPKPHEVGDGRTGQLGRRPAQLRTPPTLCGARAPVLGSVAPKSSFLSEMDRWLFGCGRVVLTTWSGYLLPVRTSRPSCCPPPGADRAPSRWRSMQRSRFSLLCSGTSVSYCSAASCQLPKNVDISHLLYPPFPFFGLIGLRHFNFLLSYLKGFK